MEDWLGEVQVSKVSWAVSHVAGTCGTAGVAVDATLTRVHQPPKFGSPILVYFRILYTPLCC